MVDYQRQLDSVFSVVGKQYDSISKKVIIWNKSWEDPNNNRLKLLPVLKWKYTEKAEPSLVISDAISQIVAIDSIESSVYVYDIKSSDLSLKARSTPFILELSKKNEKFRQIIFHVFF
ncbi:hypothetical protein DU508_17055 [Pedobacter chinensis]|uniref:Uncharacterized protein n=2 Tax=Pedobacter chinensis TaxID=2282421 RepID=A0A369PRX2_9SPHI|nr:hypothetical protein DU508_17055 [Pedobacter chinensis]